MPTARQTSNAGEALIKKWEGFFEAPYYDPVGVLTIGYGTIENDNLGIKIPKDMRVTEAEATELMRHELRAMEKRVNGMLKVQLTQYEFDALMSFSYNLGTGALSRSTLMKLINSGQKNKAFAQFSRWVWATDRRTGKRVKLRGLVNRRRDEALMFQGKPVDRVPDAKIVSIPKGDVVAEKKGALEAAKDVASKPEAAGGGIVVVLAGFIAQYSGDPIVLGIAGLVIVGVVVAGYLYWDKEREFAT